METPKYTFLPTDYSVRETSCLFYKNKRIASGFAKVESVTNKVLSSGRVITTLDLTIISEKAKHSRSYTTSELDATSFSELVNVLYFELPHSSSVEHFKQTIRYQLSRMHAKMVYEIDHLGFNTVCGKKYYAFGQKVIGEQQGSVNDICVSSSLKDYKLEYTEQSNHELEIGLDKYLSIKPAVSLAMFAYLTLGLSRQVFLDANVPIKFVLFIVGKNQSFKTTLSSLFFNVYGRHENLERHVYNFTSSEALLRTVLDQSKDITLVFDDLNLSDSKAEMRTQERLVSSLIRTAANNIPKQTKNSSYLVSGQLVFCGEYTLRNISTNNRIFLLQFASNMFEKSAINELYKYADVIPQFAYEFVAWLLQNYSDMTAFVYNEYNVYLRERETQATSQERLHMSEFVLNAAFQLCCNFFEYKGWSNLLRFKGEFKMYISNLVNEQIEELHLNGEVETDYCFELFHALNNAYQFEDFPEKKPNGEVKPDLYYSAKKDLLCITGDYAASLLFERTKKVVSYRHIFEDFYKHGFLDLDNNKANSRTKYVGTCKKRYYCIFYSEWKQYVEENDPPRYQDDYEED